MSAAKVAVSLAPVGWHLLTIRAQERAGRRRLEAIQARRLRALLRHAATQVPYYRRRWDPQQLARVRTAADLPLLPAIDRDELRGLPETELLADGFGADNTRAARTSGSSGIPVTVRFSDSDLGYLRASYLADLLACGLRARDRLASFRTVAFQRHPLERIGVGRSVHMDTSLPLDEQVELLLLTRPTYLAGFPYVIASLVEELQRRGIEYRDAHTVMFGGERLPPAVRERVLHYLGARGHEVYASVEAFTIARSCPEGVLHLRTAQVVVEVEHDDGSVSVADGEGEAIVTRLRGEAMPLVRYRIGDRVRIRPNDCPCRRADAPIVERVVGRVEERVVASDGRRFHPGFLTDVLDSFPQVRRFQMVQRRPGALRVRIIPAAGVVAGFADAVRRELRVRLPGWQVDVELTDRVRVEPNGKVRVIYSELTV